MSGRTKVLKSALTSERVQVPVSVKERTLQVSQWVLISGRTQLPQSALMKERVQMPQSALMSGLGGCRSQR
jgi:hypothetical protein